MFLGHTKVLYNHLMFICQLAKCGLNTIHNFHRDIGNHVAHLSSILRSLLYLLSEADYKEWKSTFIFFVITLGGFISGTFQSSNNMKHKANILLFTDHFICGSYFGKNSIIGNLVIYQKASFSWFSHP